MKKTFLAGVSAAALAFAVTSAEALEISVGTSLDQAQDQGQGQSVETSGGGASGRSGAGGGDAEGTQGQGQDQAQNGSAFATFNTGDVPLATVDVNVQDTPDLLNSNNVDMVNDVVLQQSNTGSGVNTSTAPVRTRVGGSDTDADAFARGGRANENAHEARATNDQRANGGDVAAQTVTGNIAAHTISNVRGVVGVLQSTGMSTNQMQNVNINANASF